MVKILAFTDPHGEIAAAKSIISLARKERPELILCSGDFSYFGMRHEQFLKTLGALKQTIWFVPGNHETMDFSKEIETWYPFMKDLSYQTVGTAGIRISGVPGTNEYWPGQSDEDEAFETASKMCGLLDPSKPLVFLSHFPPMDTAIAGMLHPTADSGGSRVVRRIVTTLKPALVICGHYHQDFGKSTSLDTTRLVNPGPEGMILHV